MVQHRLGIIHKEDSEAERLAFHRSWGAKAIDVHLKSMLNPKVFEWGRSHYPDEAAEYGWQLLVKTDGRRLVPYAKKAKEIDGDDLAECKGPRGRGWKDHHQFFGELSVGLLWNANSLQYLIVALTFPCPREIWHGKNWHMSPADLEKANSDSEDLLDNNEDSKLDPKGKKQAAAAAFSPGSDSPSDGDDDAAAESTATHTMSTRSRTQKGK